MSMVRYATKCDRCGSRSPEYTAWPTCRDCQDHVCPLCSTKPSQDEHNQADCDRCKLDGTQAHSRLMKWWAAGAALLILITVAVAWYLEKQA